jgi:hypothetical protein
MRCEDGVVPMFWRSSLGWRQQIRHVSLHARGAAPTPARAVIVEGDVAEEPRLAG